jgi:hypothetical protein
MKRKLALAFLLVLAPLTAAAEEKVPRPVNAPATATAGDILVFGASPQQSADSGKTLPAGAVVGTSDTQTLTGKSIDAGQLTGTVAIGRLPVGTISGTVAAGDDSRIAGAAQKASNLSDLLSASAARSNLGLGTAATQNTGTSGANVPLLSGSNSWSNPQTFTVAPVFTDAAGTRTALGLGTAAVKNTGSSGGTVPLLNAAATISAIWTYGNGDILYNPLASSGLLRELGAMLTESCNSAMNYNNIDFDGSTNYGTRFNTQETGNANPACWLVPINKNFTTSAKVNLTIAAHRLEFRPGAKVSLLAGAGNIADVVDLQAADDVVSNLEIDGNATNQSFAISGLRISNDVTGIRLLGRTYLHDTKQYGAHVVGGASVFAEDIKCANTLFDCLHAQNVADTANARIAVQHLRADRSMLDPSTAAHPAVQIYGTAAHPTALLLQSIDLANPILPTGFATAEGVELRYGTGYLVGGLMDAGTLQLSIATGMNGFANGDLVLKGGANVIGHEVANTDMAALVQNIASHDIIVDGNDAAGVPRLPRAFTVDGTGDSKALVYDDLIGRHFTDDGFIVAATPLSGTTNLSDILVGNAFMDASDTQSVNNVFGDHDGFHFVASGTSSVKRYHVANGAVEGGNAATECLFITNASYGGGRIACHGIKTDTGTLVRLVDDGNVLATLDYLEFNIADEGANPTANQFTVSLPNGGAIGHHTAFGNYTSFTPYAAGYWGWVKDVNTRRIEVYGASSPNGTEDGAVGSLAADYAGNQYFKTGVLGNFTWIVARAASGDVGTAIRTPASSAESCSAGQLVADTSYVYACVAANTWKRSALAAF